MGLKYKTKVIHDSDHGTLYVTYIKSKKYRILTKGYGRDPFESTFAARREFNNLLNIYRKKGVFS